MELNQSFKRMVAESIDKANELIDSGMTTTEAKDCLRNFVQIVDQYNLALQKTGDDSKLNIISRKYENARKDVFRFKKFKDATVGVFASHSKEIQEICRSIDQTASDPKAVVSGTTKIRTALKSMVEAFAKTARR